MDGGALTRDSSSRTFLLRGGLLGRMQNLVSDVVSAETSQSKAERIMRETMEVAWTKAAGAKVTKEEIIFKP